MDGYYSFEGLYHTELVIICEEGAMCVWKMCTCMHKNWPWWKTSGTIKYNFTHTQIWVSIRTGKAVRRKWITMCIRRCWSGLCTVQQDWSYNAPHTYVHRHAHIYTRTVFTTARLAPIYVYLGGEPARGNNTPLLLFITPYPVGLLTGSRNRIYYISHDS